MMKISVRYTCRDTICLEMDDGRRGQDIFLNRDGSWNARNFGHLNIYSIAYCMRVL